MTSVTDSQLLLVMQVTVLQTGLMTKEGLDAVRCLT